MATISSKLPDELKLQVEIAASTLGTTPDAFMIAAIAQATQVTERRSSFYAQALAAREAMRIEGTGFVDNEVQTYLRHRSGGGDPSRPSKKNWRA